MRAASFNLSPELLAEVLHLPPTATIFSAHSYITRDGRVLIQVVADDSTLPEADAPHETVPRVTLEGGHIWWHWDVPT